MKFLVAKGYDIFKQYITTSSVSDVFYNNEDNILLVEACMVIFPLSNG